ncbi:MAG: putative lipid II flippase FtsW, partial [Cytophagales bacterium]|nr:putative lipid II flippase FtsW [Armatimonadota bacterium]
VMVFNASYPLAIEFYDDKWFFAKKQMLWAVIGLTGLFVARRIPYWKWQALAVPGLVLTSLLLIAVHFVGHDAQGGQRWIGYGPIRIQPSEFAKFALALYLAKVISARPRLTRELWGGVIPVLGVSLVSVVLTERQPDLGTAVTMLLTVLIVLFAGGAKARWMAGFLAVFAVLGMGAVLHKGTDSYRWKRVITFVNPQADPLGAGWQITHSTIALGTGGLTGLGFGESREKRYGGLPAQRTDFIFAIVGEEFGLVGTGGVLLLFLVLAGRGYHIAQGTRDPFGSLLAVGITSMIAVQSLTNIAVVTASIPATGVPLPFISYGGSSLAATLFSIGVLLNISQHPYRREPRPRRSRRDDGGTPEPSAAPPRRNTAALLDSLEREGALR